MVQRERCHVADWAPAAAGQESVRIGDLVPGALKRLGLEEDLWLRALENEWVELVGSMIAKHARPGRYERGRLIVFVDSSVWLNELKRYSQKEMLSKLQQRFGADKIARLFLQPDPDGAC